MNKQEYIDNNGNKFFADELLKCPFCNSEPKMIFKGNNFTKMRSVKIKCKNPMCRAEITNSGIRGNHERVAGFSIESWNKRYERDNA